MTNTDVTLLPCPFCGSEPYIDDADMGHSVVCCQSLYCRAQGPFKPTDAEAITAWNQRATPEPAGDLVETVAKSIATAFGSPWDWFSPQGQEAARTEARAAIAAMPDRAALVDDGWEQVGYYQEKLRQAEETIESFNERLPEFMAFRTQLATSQADAARLREAMERARKAPMIDHRDAANSVYGILEAAIKDTHP